ncbi:MAG: hypothetical protein V1897_05145 [Pseudomonadota bacterium]
MKKIKDKIEGMLNGITFAEMGETETALSFMNSEVEPEKDSLAPQDIKARIHGSNESRVGKFERSMSAVAFAEAGEFESANEIFLPESKPHVVALVIDNSNPNHHAIDYTVNLCRRIGATMDVLITESDQIGLHDNHTDYERWFESVDVAELTLFLRERNVQCQVHMFKGDIVENLGEYVRRHKEVTSVVYDAQIIPQKGSRAENKWHRVLETICRKLSIPLITVFDKRRVKMAT